MSAFSKLAVVAGTWLVASHGFAAETKTARLTVADAAQLGAPVARAEPGSIRESVTLFGQLELQPARAQHVHPRATGLVREVLRSTGQVVRAGEVLARIENHVGVVLEMTSPTSGMIIDRRAAVGQSVREDDQVFVVADLGVLQARLIAYPHDLHALAKGQDVTIGASYGDLRSASKVEYIAPILDPRSRTSTVIAPVANAAGAWRAGQLVTGEVVTGQSEVAMRVPAAVMERGQSGGAGAVFVRKGDGYDLAAVHFGRSDGRYVEVVAGLEAGAEILAQPPSALLEKAKATGGHDDAQ